MQAENLSRDSEFFNTKRNKDQCLWESRMFNSYQNFFCGYLKLSVGLDFYFISEKKKNKFGNYMFDHIIDMSIMRVTN